MIERKNKIVVKRDINKVAKTQPLELFPIFCPTYTIPLPYDSNFESQCMKSSNVNPYLIFGRSGMIPFLMTDEGPIILLTVYKGIDRGVPVLELSDFGGRVEKKENFLTTACWEAAEESLGLINFINRNNSIHKESYSSYNQDCSVIVTAVPVKYNGNILDFISNYSSIKEDINGSLEDIYTLPKKVINNRSILFQDRQIEKLELINKAKDIPTKDRSGVFNSNETRHIVYITLENVKKLLNGEKSPIPYKLYSALGNIYDYYPNIYFVIANHLTNLLPYMENYFKE